MVAMKNMTQDLSNKVITSNYLLNLEKTKLHTLKIELAHLSNPKRINDLVNKHLSNLKSISQFQLPDLVNPLDNYLPEAQLSTINYLEKQLPWKYLNLPNKYNINDK
jgi:hypothetical protein